MLTEQMIQIIVARVVNSRILSRRMQEDAKIKASYKNKIHDFIIDKNNYTWRYYNS